MNLSHPMQRPTHLRTALKWICGSAALASAVAVNAVPWPDKPLATNISATPMTMLITGKDHRLFYEAYNDAGDIDGDGTIDIRFKPAIIYYGLFDSSLCYTHNGTADNTGLFTPSNKAGAFGVCSGATEWSGNWLNYVTTSRIDALRKVLYGGSREVDSATQTILRRAYIPQDAHSWAKEYTSIAVDKYDIRNYTPEELPATDRRHFFGNATFNYTTICSTIDTCSNMPPVMATVLNSSKRVWEWASTERPVLNGSGSGTRNKDKTVRVEVCKSPYIAGCRSYLNGQHKPIGLLHEYGENNSMMFGLLSGSYDNQLSGGRLRKVVSSFQDEVDNNTGIFTSNATIVQTFDKLRIRGFNQSSSTGEYYINSPYTISRAAPINGRFLDWGNPLAEMMYEATRYFAGKSGATSAYNVSTKPGDTTFASNFFDIQLGLTSATWDDPFAEVSPSTSKAKAQWCARSNFIAISDVSPSYDSDELPGSYFQSSTFTGDISGLNVQSLAKKITDNEPSVPGLRFIGQAGTNSDGAPSAKSVTSLENIRGLSPEDPTKEGSYYTASMAHYAKITDLRSTIKGKQSIDSYMVGLASPLPQIVVPTKNGRKVTLVPFGKSVRGNGIISASKTDYQPTNQIVDFYVETIANSSADDADATVNNGLYYAKFRINFEDVEQGGDHDMDVIAEYEIKANNDANSTVTVSVKATFQAGSTLQNLGYIISGTQDEGVYLVVQDTNESQNYYLNVPPGRTAGYCDKTTFPTDCGVLPYVNGTGDFEKSVITFTPTATPAAALLKDPMWYAAKWGGFQDRNNNGLPDLTSEWDSDGDGVPDTYFLVQNPLKLQTALRRAFDSIVARNGGGSNVIANSRVLSTSLSTDTLVFQGVFNTIKWSGNLIAYPATSASGIGDPVWNAAQLMPTPDNRKIFYSTASGTGAELPTATVPTALSSHINSVDLLRYLRGDPAKELTQGGAFRDRTTTITLEGKVPTDLGNAARLGDITHSSPVYVKDTDTVYVGANDGMLHAFAATPELNTDNSIKSPAGRELFAFIPSAVIPRLKNLAGLGYNEKHEFFVDGDIAVSSRTQTTGKNHLVAALGRGGKGLFGLDVTNVGTSTGFAPGNISWEYFSTTDTDLGYMLGRPVIAQMNNDKWVALVGNGYESTSGLAALYIFDLVNGALIKKITLAAAGNNNGLATPGTYDSNSDGKIDAIYAGDLKGNVWKFDVSDNAVSKWDLGNSGVPIYQARDAGGIAQPITAPMTAAINTVDGDPNKGQVHVFFGTGSYFRITDPSNKASQTWYSIIDRAPVNRNSPVTLLRTNMVQRNVLATGLFDGSTVRTFSAVPNTPDTGGKDGCLIDLPESGERIVTASNLQKLAEPTLIASSIIPIIDQCEPGGTGYVNAINPFTCTRLSKPFFDLNNKNNFTDDLLNGNPIGSVNLAVGMPGEAIIVGNRLVVGGSDGTLNSVRINTGALRLPLGRISWREIIRD